MPQRWLGATVALPPLLLPGSQFASAADSGPCSVDGCFNASKCWSGDFSFARCCLGEGEHGQCWGGPYSYEMCCLSHPVLSPADLTVAAPGRDHWGCGCDEAWSPAAGDTGAWDWCAVRRALMLNWDIREIYVRFLALDVNALASCPLGALQLMVTQVFSKITNAGAALESLPAYLWAEEMLSLLLVPSVAKQALGQWVASGWNTFFMLSHIRSHLAKVDSTREEELDCSSPEGPALLSHAWVTIQGGDSVPLPVTAAFIASLEGGTCRAVGRRATGDDSQPVHAAAGTDRVARRCCLPRALAYLALADLAATGGRRNETLELLQMAGVALVAGLPEGGRHESLAALLRSRWPVPDMADKLFQVPVVEFSVQDVITRYLLQVPSGPLRVDPGDPHTSFQMRIFPRREIVSDAVRFSRLPFCGMRPFLRLVERVAVGGGGPRAGPRVSLDFVEGGPHLGDCTLWAAAALERAGLDHFAVAYEPLPDASALFRQSVLANRWDGRVVVVPKALAAKDGGAVRLAYYPGHNGEGTTVRAEAMAHCGRHCDGFSEIPTVTLDASWPALRPSTMDILKLSVNGEELNTIRGARALLSKRQICTVMMHVAKAQRGWADKPSGAGGAGGPGFSAELWDILSSSGGMDVWLHLDADATGQVLDDSRPRPSTTRLRSASDLDAVFSRGALSQDYLVARQRSVSEEAPCRDSLALRHWGEVFH